jgi:hypothetical protein
MNVCRSCGASIVWQVTARGKRMPLDAVPRPDGNVVVDTIGGRPVARLVTSGEVIVGDRYMPHHATCPQSAEWKRGKASA